MVTPPQITALAPIHTSSSSVMGAEVLIPSDRWAGSSEWPEQARHTPGAMKAPAPIWTGEVSRITQLWLMTARPWVWILNP